jgi:hypothetical protein
LHKLSDSIREKNTPISKQILVISNYIYIIASV